MMTIYLERRAFVQAGAALATGAAFAAAMPSAAAQPASQVPPAAKPMKFNVKPLPFDPTKIKGLSEKMLVSHYGNNYAGAVNRLNAIAEQLAAIDFAKAPGYLINGLKREELIATNSMILHEVYFAGLGSEETRPGPALADALARDFGSVERWRAEFVAMGKAEGGGSGWVLLTWDPRDKRLVNSWAADHTTNLAGGQPVLALDMYEHAYQMDYGAKAGDYVEAFMQAIRWANADSLYAQHARS
jgi:Fe-Mn family superoxide dismutase